jgi:hypothetical protein
LEIASLVAAGSIMSVGDIEALAPALKFLSETQQTKKCKEI